MFKHIQSLKNVVGWRTDKKLVVIESDDWGSLRFADKQTRDEYLSKGYPVEKCWMSYFDTLESESDLDNLFTLVNKYSAKLTLLTNPANPDFDKILASNFEKYYYLDLSELSIGDREGNRLLIKYNNAIEEELISIGFHGREHLYVNRWLRDLKNNDEVAQLGFNSKMWGFSNIYMPNLKNGYRSAFDIDDPNDLIFQKASIVDGINLLRTLFNYDVSYFLPPDGPYSLCLNKQLEVAGIKYIGMPKVFTPPKKSLDTSTKFFWLGRKIKFDLTVITRNCIFEPTSPRINDWVSNCMKEISNAFFWQKPAIISSHRANYVGSLDIKNRDNSLFELEKLLQSILRKWPDVQFITSEDLGKLMDSK